MSWRGRCPVTDAVADRCRAGPTSQRRRDDAGRRIAAVRHSGPEHRSPGIRPDAAGSGAHWETAGCLPGRPGRDRPAEHAHRSRRRGHLVGAVGARGTRLVEDIRRARSAGLGRVRLRRHPSPGCCKIEDYARAVTTEVGESGRIMASVSSASGWLGPPGSPRTVTSGCGCGDRRGRAPACRRHPGAAPRSAAVFADHVRVGDNVTIQIIRPEDGLTTR